jgi:hypothetical protein
LLFRGWSGWSASGLAVAGGVDGEVSAEFSGGGVDDADFEVLDEHDDVGSLEGSPQADVAQLSRDAQGDGAGLWSGVVGRGGGDNPDPNVP